jgi:hypothetical protein
MIFLPAALYVALATLPLSHPLPPPHTCRDFFTDAACAGERPAPVCTVYTLSPMCVYRLRFPPQQLLPRPELFLQRVEFVLQG